MNDHDRIVENNTLLKELLKQFANHLHSHFRINLMAWGAALSAIIALVILLVKLT